MSMVNVDENHNPLIVGCNYRYTTQGAHNAHFMLVNLNLKSGMARLVTRKTKKDFWKPIDQLIYIDNANNARKAERIAKEGMDYLKALIGHKHAQNWADRLEVA